jgi:hypothetical protein
VKVKVKVKKLKIAALLLIGGVLLSEMALRLIGIVDFPIYVIDDKGHYSLKSDQSGNFLNKNKWFVNSLGFNNENEIDTTQPYIFLTGDSVVYGGNPIDYYDRIGQQLEKYIDKTVYVGALGGWSLYNELDFINKNIDIAKKSDFIIIQYDNGDLEGYAKSNGGVVHPTHQPYSATLYTLEKYILPKILKSSNQSELPPIPEDIKNNGDWRNQLLALSKDTGKKIIFVLYPDQKGFSSPELWNKQTEDIKSFISENPSQFSYIDIAEAKGWSLNLYRDGIHPNTQGNKLVAFEIANYLKKQS